MKRTIALFMLGYFAVAPRGSSSYWRSTLGGETIVKVTAKKFEYSPSRITVKKGVPVSLELTSEDTKHGFNLPDFKVRADVKPGAVTRVTFTPDKTGSFPFACDVFCGSGHEDMSGTLEVVD
jgi:cytochrome c oxidase subunit 2